MGNNRRALLADRIYLRHVALLFILAVIWSSSFTTIKVAVETIPPLTLVAVRMVVAGVLLYMVLRLRGLRLPPLGRQWWSFFLLGLTGNAFPFFLISWGETGIDSGAAAILMAVMPLVTLGLAHFFTESDRMTVVKFAGMAIGFGGVVLLVGPDALTRMGDKTIFELSVAGGAVFYAITAVLTRRLPSGGDPLQRGTAVTLCAVVQMVPISLLMDAPWLLAPSTPAVLSAIYLGVFPTGVAAILYFHLIAERGTTFFSVINYIIPCLGVVWGVAFLGEGLPVQALIALGVILCGVFVANLPSRR